MLDDILANYSISEIIACTDLEVMSASEREGFAGCEGQAYLGEFQGILVILDERGFALIHEGDERLFNLVPCTPY